MRNSPDDVEIAVTKSANATVARGVRTALLPRLALAALCTAAAANTPQAAQSAGLGTLAMSVGWPDFLCGTGSPSWRGTYTTAAAAYPDGTGLYFHQDPPILTADYQGTVTLRDFTVVGDRPTMRIYYQRGAPGHYEFDEFERVTTRALDGVLVSVFEPAWSMAALLDRAAGGLSIFWDNQGVATLLFGGDATAAPGQLPASARPMNLRTGSKNLKPVAVTKVSDTVQFSSHVVNLVIPGYGDSRVLTGDQGFPLDIVARAFYTTFEDSYDTLVVIPANFHFSSFGGFHQNVQNRIDGIGLPSFDNTRNFGSQGVLQGVEYARGINNVGVKHEQAHQWGDYFDWSRIGDITVTDTAHTPVWANRETPLPTRVPWWLRLSQDGTEWRAVRAAFPQMFSPMLLYAMGRLDKEQVPPFVLFDNQQQFVSAPGAATQGTFKSRTVFDAIRVHGERRGPSVGDSLSRANIVISTRALISAQEMAYWTYYAERSEDPNGTGVRGWSGDGSFDRSTGVDLRTNIRPRSLPALPGSRDVDDKPFSRGDIVGLTLEENIPSRLTPGAELKLRGEIIESRFAGDETVTVTVRDYQTTTPVLVRSQQVGASKRFEVTIQFPPEQRGVYGFAVNLARAGHTTTLAPIVVQ